MKIGTLSLVVGDASCNAACPFCISKMTAKAPPTAVLKAWQQSGQKRPRMYGPWINTPRLLVALQFSKMANVSTVMLTGKGEPTLFPAAIGDYLKVMKTLASDGFRSMFPFIEIQTNGFLLETKELNADLRSWEMDGLTTVSISIVDIDSKNNAKIMGQKAPSKNSTLIRKLHDYGFSVRINLTLMKGAIDNWTKLEKAILWCKSHNVEQFTFRHAAVPQGKPRNDAVLKWTLNHQISTQDKDMIRTYFTGLSTKLLELPHGAIVADIGGQNVCFNNCITPPSGEDVRQLIFFPNGTLRYDWVHEGAVLL